MIAQRNYAGLPFLELSEKYGYAKLCEVHDRLLEEVGKRGDAELELLLGMLDCQLAEMLTLLVRELQGHRAGLAAPE